MDVLDLIVKDLEEIKTDIKDIRGDLKDINSFKWKLVGVTSTFAFLITIAGGFVINLLQVI